MKDHSMLSNTSEPSPPALDYRKTIFSGGSQPFTSYDLLYNLFNCDGSETVQVQGGDGGALPLS